MLEHSLNKMSQQPSLPTTPNPHISNQQQQQATMFPFPPSHTSVSSSENSTPLQTKIDLNKKTSLQHHHPMDDASQQNPSKNPIKNLTAHFMMPEMTANSDTLNASLSIENACLFVHKNKFTGKTKGFLNRQKSKSDSNLYFDVNTEAKSASTFISKSIPSQKFQDKNQKPSSIIIMPDCEPTINEQVNGSMNHNRMKHTAKSETRDSNIKEPFILNRFTSLVNGKYSNTTDSSTNTYESVDCSLSQTSINLLTSNYSLISSIETNDPISSYFSSKNKKRNFFFDFYRLLFSFILKNNPNKYHRIIDIELFSPIFSSFKLEKKKFE